MSACDQDFFWYAASQEPEQHPAYEEDEDDEEEEEDNDESEADAEDEEEEYGEKDERYVWL